MQIQKIFYPLTPSQRKRKEKDRVSLTALKFDAVSARRTVLDNGRTPLKSASPNVGDISKIFYN